MADQNFASNVATLFGGTANRFIVAAGASSVVSQQDASTARTTLGLGTLATQSPTGTPDGTKFLRDDFSWQTVTGGGGTPGGSSGEVQFNNAGSFGGAAAVVYAATGTHLVVTAQSATTIPIRAKGAASQTGPYFETQNSAGTRRIWIDPSSGSQGTDTRLRHGTLGAYIGWDATDWLVLAGGNGTLCYHAFVWGTSVTSRLRTDGTITLQSGTTDSGNNNTLFVKNGALFWRGGSGTITQVAPA